MADGVPPPAPPLPPPAQQRYGQRAATAFARLTQPFFAGNARAVGDGTAHGQINSNAPTRSLTTPTLTSIEAQTLEPGPRSSSPVSSRTAFHKTGIPIFAVDLSPDRTHAVIAGREILKTLRVQHANCTEELNLRNALATYAAAHHTPRDAASAHHRDQLAVSDVKWSNGRFDSTIATAVAHGRIAIYDLKRPALEIGRLQEHTRQVHRLAFNPHQGALLLSGSQDGSVRMWDLRDLRAGDGATSSAVHGHDRHASRPVRQAKSIRSFLTQHTAVRDIRWSPTDGVEFAVGSDGGGIQRWDFRRENAPLLKITAHDKTCYSVDWHPAGRYLASGGADKTVKVWDFGVTDRRLKPLWQLRMPQAVRHARWRPGAAPSESVPDGGNLTRFLRQSAVLATSYVSRDPRIHTWDLQRPEIPLQELDRYDSPATDLLWCSEELLWTVGVTGTFTQSDLRFAPRPLDRLNVNPLAIAPNGEISLFAASRKGPQDKLNFSHELGAKPQKQSGTSSDSFGPDSRNASEVQGDDALHLSSSLQARRNKIGSHGLSLYTKTSASPDSREDSQVDLLEPFKSFQVAAIGSIAGTSDVRVLKYLARKYHIPPLSSRSLGASLATHDKVSQAFEHNSLVASRIGQQHLARMWRVLAIVVCRELSQAEKGCKPKDTASRASQGTSWRLSLSKSGKKPEAANDSPARASNLSARESTSNMPTPLAKAASNLPNVPPLPSRALGNIDEYARNVASQRKFSTESASPSTSGEEQILDSPVITFHPARDDHNRQTNSIDLDTRRDSNAHLDSFPDMDEQMEEQRAAMSNYRAKPRQILRLEDPFGLGESQSLAVQPRIDRHDSTESFQLMSTSSDGGERNQATVGSFGESFHSDFSNPPARSLSGSGTSELGYSHSPRRTAADTAASASHHDAESMPHQSATISSPQMSSSQAHRRVSTLARPPLARPADPITAHVELRREDSFRTSQKPSEETSDALANFDVENHLSETQSTVLWPCSTANVVPSLISYHLETLADPQLPSLLALWLAPFYPSLFPRILSCSYLIAYHDRLTSLGLFVEAAALRRACENLWPEVSDLAIGPGTSDWRCGQCGLQYESTGSAQCERCHAPFTARCGVCELSQPPPTIQGTADILAGASRWSWCEGCGHGGHSSCVQVWFEGAVGSSTQGHMLSHDIDGAGICPILGCGHDCVDGARRKELLACDARARDRWRAERGHGPRNAILQDDWSVSESGAVRNARRLVNRSHARSPGPLDRSVAVAETTAN